MSARKVQTHRRWSAPQWLLSLGFIAVLATPTAWLAKSVRLAKVPSESMAPTLVPGDVLALRIDAYRQHPPRRGDVIVFRHPEEGLLVKRVIGEPGEWLTVVSGRVLLKNQWLEEPYAQGGQVAEPPVTVHLESDQLFVMGDNRDHAKDSRDFGPVATSQVVGRVTGIIWPLARRCVLPRFADGTPPAAEHR